MAIGRSGEYDMHKFLCGAMLVLLAASTAWCADTIAIQDSSGAIVANLPVVQRGNVRLIPLDALARPAGWTLLRADSQFVVTLPGEAITIRLGNPFVRVNDRFLQLRFPPEEWDGSLWIPFGNLRDLFEDRAEPDATEKIIRLRFSAVIENKPDTLAAVAPPTAAPKMAAPQNTPPEPTAPATASQPWVLKTVIVDPGHGGKDTGARGLLGLMEKNVTLDLATRLVRLLKEKKLNAELTRSDDEFVSLQDRTHFANQHHGDLFVSIHCNSNRDPSIHGLETYFLKPARTQKAVDAAMRENSSVKLEDAPGNYQDLTQQNYILLTMATAQYMKDSEIMAANALHEISQGVGFDSRGVDQAGFYVLMGASMPAVLVECGYLSNADDVRYLTSEKGRQKIAEALLESIMKTRDTLEASVTR
jgi:N-acetylmuramoyl-L-alanine amidase